MTLTLNVSGMSCGGCEAAITRALSQLPGVEHVQASHTAGSVVVTMRPGSETEPAVIRARLEAQGYSVST